MAEKLINKCSTFLVITKMQIELTMRFHHTQIEMATIKRSRTQVIAQAS